MEIVAPVDHGLSRSALSHLKGFWSARQDEYEKAQAQLAYSNTSAYGGIWESPRSGSGFRGALYTRISRPSLRIPYDSDAAPRTFQLNMNAPIYRNAVKS